MSRLTGLQIERLRTPGRYAAGEGLYLQVTGTGTRSWLFRYQLRGRRIEMGLGAYPLNSLAAAREKVLDCRRAIAAGRNPLEERRAVARATSALSATTFDDVATEYIAAQKAGWHNPKSPAQWKASLTAYASPHIGQSPVDTISVNDVLAVLKPIWSSKTETASRVRGRIEAILDYAKARGIRQGDNPARWKGNLDHLLPAKARVRKVKHHEAVPIETLPKVMATLAKMEGAAPLAVRFVILTAGRAGEVTGAKWREVDTERDLWTVPDIRMKAKREHRVPLSNQALTVLREAAAIRQDEHVFPGGVHGKPLSLTSLMKALRKAGAGEATVHGLRSTFRDWAAERDHASRELAEAALAHVVGDATERAYARSDLLERRREMMQRWAAFACGSRSAGKRRAHP
jgi:integrase